MKKTKVLSILLIICLSLSGLVISTLWNKQEDYIQAVDNVNIITFRDYQWDSQTVAVILSYANGTTKAVSTGTISMGMIGNGTIIAVVRCWYPYRTLTIIAEGLVVSCIGLIVYYMIPKKE
jgi:tetrahydromethanopterin S-methyltransferase subunit C